MMANAIPLLIRVVREQEKALYDAMMAGTGPEGNSRECSICYEALMQIEQLLSAEGENG